MINQQGKDLTKAGQMKYNFNINICVDMHLYGLKSKGFFLAGIKLS